MLSEKTIAEMHAGALNVNKHAGEHGLNPQYMDAIIRTQQRANWLQTLERQNKISIVRTMRPHTNMKRDKNGALLYGLYVIHVGEHKFTDILGEQTGTWPSEILTAQVALALGAGEGTHNG